MIANENFTVINSLISWLFFIAFVHPVYVSMAVRIMDDGLVFILFFFIFFYFSLFWDLDKRYSMISYVMVIYVTKYNEGRIPITGLSYMS